MNIFTCNIFLFVAVSLLGFATTAHACEDGGQQYIKVNEYSSALNSEETVTSIRIVKGFWYGDVFITVGESERKITERASCAWIISEGREIVYASDGGSGGFEGEGQTLHIYNVKTRQTREVLSQYYMIDEVKEAKLASGATVLLVEMSDGNAGNPYFSVVDPTRGEVYFRRLAKPAAINGDKITLNICRFGDWDRYPPDDKHDPTPKSTKTVSLSKVLKNKVICNKPDEKSRRRTESKTGC